LHLGAPLAIIRAVIGLCRMAFLNRYLNIRITFTLWWPFWSPRNDTLWTRPGPEGSNRSRRLMCRGVAIRVATQSLFFNKLLHLLHGVLYWSQHISLTYILVMLFNLNLRQIDASIAGLLQVFNNSLYKECNRRP